MLTGKVVFITGAAAGIGRATVASMLADNAHVAAADIDGEAVQALAAELGENRVLPLRMDVTDTAQVRGAIGEAMRHYGHIDVLVNNAGWGYSQSFIDNDEEFWDRLIAINLKGPIACAHSVLAHMLERGSGTIINVSSDAGRVGSSGETVYAACKAGTIAFTKSLAREVARKGILVNCVAPGPTNTAFLNKQPEKYIEALTRAIPMRRVAEPAEIAEVIKFFAGPGAGFVTGQVLSVSGGLTMAG